MNHTQIKYFLTAARCLNFTEAAQQLFITQPALSQQISAIEAELNMQLFIRHKNKLRLTPAALILLDELPPYEKYYQDIINKARVAHTGRDGLLRIGILQGQMLWIDAGLGVGIINANSYIAVNPNVRIIENFHVGTNHFVIAWHRNNSNPATALFSNYITEYIKDNGIL